MMDKGDLHNFGKQVSRKSGQNAYFKPRCIFWEYFYFSKQSPLYQFFKSQLNSSDFSFFDNHFQLQIDCLNNYQEGVSLEIKKHEIDSNVDFYSLGMLTSYCTFFGIMDLHIGNVIYNGKFFIPIDIELVNASLRLPNETLLFPINEEEKPYSVYHKVSEYLTKDKIELFLTGFYKMYSHLSSNAFELIKFLKDYNFKPYPIRVITLHTLKYKTAIENKIELIDEEKLQLSRGDIPFFFKFINDDLMYFFDENGNKIPVQNQNERTLKKFNQLAKDFNEILDQKRLEALLVNSNLYFAKLFYIEKEWNNFCHSDFKLKVDQEVISFEFKHKIYQAKV